MADPHPPDDGQTRRHERRRAQAQRRRRQRIAALATTIITIVVGVAVAVGLSTGATHLAASHRPAPRLRGRRVAARLIPDEAAVPILMYHVINPAPAGAPFPGLYVPTAEFAAQMHALAAAGFHAVTMDQVWRYWHEGTPLPRGRPIVVSFDNGYRSQYVNALPVLRALKWVGVENLQLSGLPPSQGGLSRAQVRALVAAGWELDTQGFSHADLITLAAAALRYQVGRARRTIRARYHVAANWFCYPSGHYDAAVVAAVIAAGYRGSTTVVRGWATHSENPDRLPRLRVLAGTSPAALLSEVQAMRGDAPPPSSYSA